MWRLYVVSVRYYCFNHLSGNLKGFNAINAIKGVKAAAVNGLKDFFQNPVNLVNPV